MLQFLKRKTQKTKTNIHINTKTMENKEIDILESINFHQTDDDIQHEPTFATNSIKEIQEMQEKNFEAVNTHEEILIVPLETNAKEAIPEKKQTNKILASFIFIFPLIRID